MKQSWHISWASLRRFSRNRQGATAVEFAFVAPVLFLMTMAVAEIGLMMFNMVTIEGALREAARYGITGQSSSGNRTTDIINTLKKYAVGPVDIEASNISMEVYNSFSAVGQPEPFTDMNGNGQYDPGEPYTDINNNGQWDADQGTNGAGSGNQIVEYTVHYTWNILTPVMRQFLGQDGKLPLTASVVVQNEPCPVGNTCNSSGTGWQYSSSGTP